MQKPFGSTRLKNFIGQPQLNVVGADVKSPVAGAEVLCYELASGTSCTGGETTTPPYAPTDPTFTPYVWYTDLEILAMDCEKAKAAIKQIEDSMAVGRYHRDQIAFNYATIAKLNDRCLSSTGTGGVKPPIDTAIIPADPSPDPTNPIETAVKPPSTTPYNSGGGLLGGIVGGVSDVAKSIPVVKNVKNWFWPVLIGIAVGSYFLKPSVD